MLLLWGAGVLTQPAPGRGEARTGQGQVAELSSRLICAHLPSHAHPGLRHQGTGPSPRWNCFHV